MYLSPGFVGFRMCWVHHFQFVCNNEDYINGYIKYIYKWKLKFSYNYKLLGDGSLNKILLLSENTDKIRGYTAHRQLAKMDSPDIR